MFEVEVLIGENFVREMETIKEGIEIVRDPRKENMIKVETPVDPQRMK